MQAPPPTLWLRLRLRSASDQATGSMSASPVPDAPMSTRQLVDRVIASRQSRSRVTPAQHPRLPFRVKGTLMAEQYDDDLELRVMNIQGNLQPAKSFREFMRMVFVELVALNDVLFADLKLRYP